MFHVKHSKRNGGIIMSYTNHTTNLQLPQWLASDKPNWDIDLNNAFQRIDNFAGEKNTGDASLSNRINENQEAITSLQGEVTTLEGVVNTQGERITDLEEASTSHVSSITKLNNDVDALDSRTTSLETRVSSDETDIDALQSQVGLNTGNITSLQGNITSLQARKEIKIGSINYYNTSTSNRITHRIRIQIDEEDFQTPVIAIIPPIVLQSGGTTLYLYVDLGAEEFFDTQRQAKRLFYSCYESSTPSASPVSTTVTFQQTLNNGISVLEITFDTPISTTGEISISQSNIPSNAVYIPMT